MSTPPKFRAYLRPNDTDYYYTDSDGLVQIATSPTFPEQYALRSELANWADWELKWGRSEVYFGVFRSVSSNAQFADDGADICRKVYYTEGVEGTLIFELWERQDGAAAWTYELLYSGEVDFSGAVDEHDQFTASIAESGLIALIKANERTPYEIPINAAGGSLEVYNDGTMLQAGYINGTISSSYSPANAGQIISVPTASDSIRDGDYTIGEQKVQGVMPMGIASNIIVPVWGVNSAEHANFLYRVDENYFSTVDVKLRLNHNIQYNANAANAGNIILQTRLFVCSSTSGTPYQNVLVYQDPGAPLTPGQTRQVTINTDSTVVTMNPDDRLYYLVEAVMVSGSPIGADTGFIFFGGQQIDVLIDFKLAPTVIEGYRHYQVADKIVEAATGGAYTVHSDFLYDPSGLVDVVDSKPFQVVLTSGDAVRRLAYSTTNQPTDPVLRITLRDYFQDVFGRWMLGMGIDANGNLIIEPLTHFFDDTDEIYDLGEITGLKVEPYTALSFNQFKTGYPKSDSNNLNGKDAFNTTSVWKMPMAKMPAKEADFTSPFIADMYTIEHLRANLSNKKTTDSQNDNDTILLDIDTTQTSGAYNLRRLNNSGNTSGILSPDFAYNASLSPGREPWRLGPYLHSVAYQLDSRSITFQTSDKNQFLVSNVGSGTITENAPILIGDLGDILYKPTKFTFSAVAPINLGALMAAKPYGYFKATYYGKVIKGFLGDVGIKPGKSQSQQWTLIATPSCDLTQFYPQP